MKKIVTLASIAFFATIAVSCNKTGGELKPWDEEPVKTDVLEEGYYKDLFMDGGIRLTSRTTLPSATTLGMSMEFLACPSAEEDLSASDTIYQSMIMSDSDMDSNGVLLYPDGEPRFKMIYMNGGKSTSHCTSLADNGCKGIENIRTFYYNGGSYVGTCAGAFMTGTGYDAKESYVYLRFCNFKPQHTGVNEQYMSMTVEPDCPLLKYYDFGGDKYIADIYHNGGCYANEGLCEGAETLLRYSTSGHANADARAINSKISSWAFKKDIYSGRLCAIGSHPESVSSGERLDLMCAFEKYAIDGRGIATLKDTLLNGQECAGNRIGDLQNHHFGVWVPEGAKNLSITLNRAGDYDTYLGCNLQLFIKKGTFAFESAKPDYSITDMASTKDITILTPEKGLYYVCVRCATTVEATKTTYTNEKGKTGTYFKYTGHTEVLNGVPYTIVARWDK